MKFPAPSALREFVILLAVSLFTLLYGVVPIFGGDQLGLVGADEPRYAQVAREMLSAHSEICHDLNAKMVPRSLHWTDLHNSFHCIA
ncbi:MAG: dolichyl-phosphate-mannose-protein mannosyltransferase family protein, partial [Edaphobacter sp.]|nr:dolichyl-phosphate-mannose-protein mannosyltransferase family protein [Edaphobacter sp.]